MYLMYVDESGDTGRAGSPTRYFILSGIVVHESEWRNFLENLIAFRRMLKSVYGLPVRTELHASEFINGRVGTLKRHERLAILRNTLDELAKFDFISITNVVVDKQGKPDDYDVFNSAWGTLFQRFENTLQHGNFPGGYRKGHGLVITDATAGHKLARLVRRMAVYNPIPSDPRHGGVTRNIPIRKIIEDPFGKDSRDTLPVQMADVVAYFLAQKFAPNSFIRRQRAMNYFDRLQPVLNVRASRYDTLGIVKL
ncbi:MAG: DUF3800 domain-containing protein [Hyphomicrobium sp.]